MSIVNFAIPSTLEKRIQKTIKEKGFASKAEFFRFAALHAMDALQPTPLTEDERCAYLTAALRNKVTEKYKYKVLPSLEEQLADI